MKRILLYILVLALAVNASAQTPCSDKKVVTPMVPKPTGDSIVSVTCTTLTVAWKGNVNQTYIADVTFKNPSTGNIDTIAASSILCDNNLLCTASIPVIANTNVNWSVQAMQLISDRPFYSYVLRGKRDISIPECVNKPPTVNIISPANGATYTASSTISISVEANDPDGTIKTLEFYNGTTSLYTESSEGTTTWQWKNAPPGTYTITAKATDNYGLQTTSAPVTITVTAPKLSDAASINLAPNPANTMINIYTTGLQENKRLTLTVISASGIKMKTVQLSSSTEALQLDVSSLPGGVYTIKLICGDKAMYKKFIKL